ncbi:hypothetical protein G8770_03750 [Aestuariicella hydrocarbonica]|uniref:Uncharacterized protein n=1 Tax=Pseudomaricurvus hydrocarbonicus TaxID=1470433 RepID=A0A9E5JTN4_9GAMM|nr:hypothetical protein [Aestuariicella hydrocarbonica]NHO64660.1 hypothetical protein [Aestuariicella hydrocarbonica]
MDQLLAILKSLNEKRKRCLDQTDSDEDEYTNGYQAGVEEGRKAAFREAMALVAEQIPLAD